MVDQNSGGTATAVTGLVIQSDVISNNGLDGNTYYGGNQDGVRVQQGNGGVQFPQRPGVRQQPGRPVSDGGASPAPVGPPPSTAAPTTARLAIYGGPGYGIYDTDGSLIEDARVYANPGVGIYAQRLQRRRRRQPGHRQYRLRQRRRRHSGQQRDGPGQPGLQRAQHLDRCDPAQPAVDRDRQHDLRQQLRHLRRQASRWQPTT